ncbi:MAG TPA: nucleotidyltransferase domain-containing protein [Devosia sp.]
MNQQSLVTRVVDALEPDERIRGLFLTGSFGRGTADQWSDVDLLALVEKEQQEAVAADWRQVLEAITPIVYWNRLPWAFVLNAVSEDWLRCDLSLAGPGETRGMTQDRAKPLIDRDGVYSTLSATLPPPEIDRRKLEGTVNEFIRVLGLTPVAVGRGEVELIGIGTGMLRRMLTDLLVIEMNHADTGGILHLSRLLDAERMALMETIPVPERSIESALASQAALARTFLPRAKALYAELGMDWPERFEEATRKTLATHIPGLDTGW